MQVQTSTLVGWFKGARKQWPSVYSPFFPAKKGEKIEKWQRGQKTAKTYYLDAEFGYTDPRISKILSQIQFFFLYAISMFKVAP